LNQIERAPDACHQPVPPIIGATCIGADGGGRRRAWEFSPVIGSVVNFSGSFAFGGFRLTGLSGGGSSYAASASSRLLAGAALQSLDNSRTGIDQIKAALTKLRDTLQAARDNADAVPGRTTLKAVTADIEQVKDQPTYVRIDGTLVQTGMITVSQGTKAVIVGYERVTRAPLDVGKDVKSLSAAVTNLVAAVGRDSAGGLAAQVSALLKSSDFQTAVATPDAASLDAGIAKIDGVLAQAEGVGFTVNTRASAAAQVDLGSLLLGASPSVIGGSTSSTTGSTSWSGSSAYQTTSTSTLNTSSGGTVSTVA
jgi:hypothetical protein